MPMRFGIAVTAGLLAAVAAGCGAKPASQDSARIVYEVSVYSGSKLAGLFSVDVDGNQHTRLTQEPPPLASDSRWSPVGDKILFSSPTSTGGEIWTIHSDGSGARRIGEGQYVSWSLDGREIAAVKRKGEIDIFSADGNRLRTIDVGIAKGENIDEGPAWSPDGRTLALEVLLDENSGHAGIYVVPADGQGTAVLISPREDQTYEGMPLWSPDGKRLAFYRASLDDNTAEAWTSRPDGSDRRLIARDMSLLAWSTDGEALLGSPGVQNSIYRYPLDGGKPTLVDKAEANRAEALGRLSQDGKWMVATSDGGALVVSRPDGSEPRALTKPVTDSYPAWSPDGTAIAFARESGGESDFQSTVYVIDANGKGERKLAAADGSLEWSPDGTALLAEIPQGEGEPVRPIVLVGPKNGKTRTIAQGGAYAWSPDGSRVAFVHDYYEKTGEFSTLNSVRRDGTDLRRLCQIDGGEHGRFLDALVWAPDGRSILVSEEDPMHPSRVLQVPANGDQARTIVSVSSQIYSLAVSPDGKQVGLVTDKGIETVSLASGERAVIVRAGKNTIDAFAWSPDGKDLGYISSPLPPFEGPASLYVAKADGTDPVLISKPGESVASFDWRPEAGQY